MSTTENLQAYFAMFDGHRKHLSTAELATIQAAYDPSVVFHTPNGDEDYDAFVANNRVCLAKGLRVTTKSVVPHPKGVEYALTLEAQGEPPLSIHSVGTIENGRIVQVDPLEYGESYDKLFADARAYSSA